MTENEAIEELKKDKDMIMTDLGIPEEIITEFEIAITALEEIQQYRAIGTVEEIQERLKSLQSWRDEHLEDITVDLVEYRELCKLEEVAHMKSLKMIIQRNGTIGKILEECAEYEAIGTVEECRKAMEKQKAKKPTYEGDGYADGELVYDTWICPNCGEHYETDYDDYIYCPNCGQAIDLSEVN